MPEFVNPQFNVSAPARVYAGAPIEEVKELNKSASDEYNINREKSDLLKSLYKNLDVRPDDIHIKNRAFGQFSNQMKAVEDKGDYQNVKYVVNDMLNSFKNDKELQGALSDRQSEIKDNNERNQRVEALQRGETSVNIEGDKGDKTKTTTKSGMAKRTAAFEIEQTQNQSKGGFKMDKNDQKISGYHPYFASDDKSTEIANDVSNLMKMAKESSVKFGNNEYQIKDINGIEEILQDGKVITYEKLANAAKQHILNQNKYAQYLQEEHQMDKNDLLTNPDGTKRIINRGDLPYSNEELQNNYVGATENQIKQLETSKDKKGNAILSDRATAAELRNKQLDFNSKINTPEFIDDLWNKDAQERRLEKIVYPAASLIAHKEINSKIFTNEGAKEYLIHQHQLARIEYEYGLKRQDIPPLVVSQGQIQMNGTDYKKINETHGQLQQDVNSKLNAWNITKNATIKNPSLEATRKEEYEQAKSKLNISQAKLEEIYNNVTPEVKEKTSKRILGMFQQQEGGTSNWDYRISAQNLQNLVDVATKKQDFETRSLLRLAGNNFSKGQPLSEENANRLKELLNNSTYLPTLKEADDERTNRGTVLDLKASGFPTEQGLKTSNDVLLKGISKMSGMIGGTLLHHPSWESNIGNILQDNFNTTQTIKTIPDIVSVPDLGYKENSPIANTIHSFGRNLLSTGSRNLVVNSGKTLDDVLGGKTDIHFFSQDKKDGDTKYSEDTPDPNKTLISYAPGGDEKYLVINYFNKDNQPLLTGKNKDNLTRSGLYVKGDDNVIGQYADMLTQYALKSGDKNTAIKLQADKNYGQYFKPLKIGVNTNIIHINHPNNQGSNNIKLIPADNVGDASKVWDEDRGEFMFNGKSFRSKLEIEKAFELATIKHDEIPNK